MGLAVPPCRVWCGASVHQAYLRSGVRLSRRLIYPDLSFGDATAGRRGLRRIAIAQIRRGDSVFHSLRKGVHRTAIVRERPRGSYLKTVEGNTSHAVRLQTPGVKYIAHAARVTIAG